MLSRYNVCSWFSRSYRSNRVIDDGDMWEAYAETDTFGAGCYGDNVFPERYWDMMREIAALRNDLYRTIEPPEPLTLFHLYDRRSGLGFSFNDKGWRMNYIRGGSKTYPTLPGDASEIAEILSPYSLETVPKRSKRLKNNQVRGEASIGSGHLGFYSVFWDEETLPEFIRLCQDLKDWAEAKAYDGREALEGPASMYMGISKPGTSPLSPDTVGVLKAAIGFLGIGMFFREDYEYRRAYDLIEEEWMRMYRAKTVGTVVDGERLARLRAALDELFEFNGDDEPNLEAMNARLWPDWP